MSERVVVAGGRRSRDGRSARACWSSAALLGDRLVAGVVVVVIGGVDIIH